MKELRGKVAVVTGGASGIGRAMAERFLDEGMKVVIADIEEPALEVAREELAARGEIMAVRADVSRGEDVEELARRSFDAHGAVHVLVNNAGVGVGGPMWDQSVADWEWVLGVNLWGVIHGIRAFVPRMLAAGGEGHVVNTASMAGLTSTPFLGIYNASKHAVVTLTETLYQEFLLTGAKLRASVVCPGWVKTNIAKSTRNRPGGSPPPNPLDQMMHGVVSTGLPPEEVARQVVEAIRDEKLYVLTHPEFMGAVKQRMTDLLAARNPPTFDPAVMLAPGK